MTWSDAQAYCQWKSESIQKKFRLPKEEEWEYVASNFGKLSPEEFFWDLDETTRFCNIEETGLGETTPVDHFPEHELAGGIHDLYGNVYEWVLDAHIRGSRSANALPYKIVRGGSFLTNFNHIAHWRRLSFSMNYCTSFLGFRTVCEED